VAVSPQKTTAGDFAKGFPICGGQKGNRRTFVVWCIVDALHLGRVQPASPFLSVVSRGIPSGRHIFAWQFCELEPAGTNGLARIKSGTKIRDSKKRNPQKVLASPVARRSCTSNPTVGVARRATVFGSFFCGPTPAHGKVLSLSSHCLRR